MLFIRLFQGHFQDCYDYEEMIKNQCKSNNEPAAYRVHHSKVHKANWLLIQKKNDVLYFLEGMAFGYQY